METRWTPTKCGFAASAPPRGDADKRQPIEEKLRVALGNCRLRPSAILAPRKESDQSKSRTHPETHEALAAMAPNHRISLGRLLPIGRWILGACHAVAWRRRV